jgi:hypothetical protein
MDDNAQIMTIEVVIFAILIILSLIFLYQLTPTVTVTNIYSNEIKVEGDSVLKIMNNNNTINEVSYDNYPLNELSHLIVTNDYENLTYRINELLHIDVQFNIWIANSTESIFWCNSSFNDYQTVSPDAEPLKSTGSVVTSTCLVGIDPYFINNTNNIFPNDYYHQGRYYSDRCDLDFKFNNYSNSEYVVILEMWSI